MKYIFSGENMKKVDQYTINNIGIPSMVLMERAALSVAENIMKNEPINKTVLCVASTGNNGADSLAVCRMLYLKGYDTCIYILGDISKASEEFKQQLKIVKNMNITILEQIENRDVIVDGIFGVGLSREVKNEYKEVVDKINTWKNIVYAVDIPSGVDASTGKILGTAIKANYTITFGGQKIGTAFYPGADYCGQVINADIGYPDDVCEMFDHIKYLEKSDLTDLPQRANYSNKGSFGKVLIIAGSKEISGAAFLAAKAAFKTGAGLVRIFTHVDNRQILARLLPEAMINTYNTEEFDEHALESCLNWCDVVAVGPGLSVGPIQQKIIKTVLERKMKTVIDADGINNISADVRLKKDLHKNVIITPHLAEMSRFSGDSIDYIKDNLLEVATKCNYQNNIATVLKDARSVIATNNGTYVNISGNNGMATAGSGDVLTGIITGLIAIGMDIDKAACFGPFIHGLAGDMAVNRISKDSLMASDIIDCISEVFLQKDKM